MRYLTFKKFITLALLPFSLVIFTNSYAGTAHIYFYLKNTSDHKLVLTDKVTTGFWGHKVKHHLKPHMKRYIKVVAKKHSTLQPSQRFYAKLEYTVKGNKKEICKIHVKRKKREWHWSDIEAPTVHGCAKIVDHFHNVIFIKFI